MGDAKRRRRRVEPTEEWEQIGPLCLWPEQLNYEEIRPVTLFGLPVSERAEQTGTSEWILYRKVARFEAEGMDSLFAADGAKRRSLPPAMRRLIVDLKAEHPPMRSHEISTVCYVRFGRRPDYRTVERVLAEEPMPLRMVRRFPPYHETEEPRERRMAVVRLHAEGRNVKSITSYLKTAFNVQRRMADWHFAKAKSWPELHAAHERWVEEYNAQYHQAHEKRPDGRRSPAEVLGVLREARLLPADLDRLFFAERYVRVLDTLGYAVWRRWRVYGEEALAGREAALWLREKTLTVEHAGEPLSRYAVEFLAGTEKRRAVGRPVLFGTAIPPAQPKLFALSALGEGGWLKTLRLEDYAPRRSRPGSLQQALIPYHEAWG